MDGGGGMVENMILKICGRRCVFSFFSNDKAYNIITRLTIAVSCFTNLVSKDTTFQISKFPPGK